MPENLGEVRRRSRASTKLAAFPSYSLARRGRAQRAVARAPEPAEELVGRATIEKIRRLVVD